MELELREGGSRVGAVGHEGATKRVWVGVLRTVDGSTVAVEDKIGLPLGDGFVLGVVTGLTGAVFGAIVTSLVSMVVRVV